MTIRYFLGGPSNSGKSTLALSLVESLRLHQGASAETIELDVWSNSYPAFEGKVTFAGRPKIKGLDWDWQTPLRERLAAFNASTADIVLGDMPGAVIDTATDFMCEHGRADAAIVVSATLEGLNEWCAYFEKRGIRVAHRCLTFQGEAPITFTNLNRTVDPKRMDVLKFSGTLVRDLLIEEKD